MASTPTAPSAQSFLHHLGLSHDHNDPHYHPELSTVGEGVFELPSYHSSMTAHVESYIANNRYVHTEDPTPPQVGPVSFLELHDDSYIEVMRTMVTMSAPTLAMMELWLRLFALIVGPLCILLLIYWEIMTPSSNSCNKTNSTTGTTVSYGKMITAVLAVASSAVVFTDSLYVYEYGREFGSGLFVISSLLGVRLVREVKRCQEDLACVEKNRVAKHKVFTALVYGLIVSTVILFARSDGGHAMRLQLEKIPLSGFVSAATTSPSTENYNPLTQISDPGIDLPTIQPGFYHSSNPFIQSITRHWEESSRSYNISTGATPYLVNGDQRTGIPFLLNKVDEQEYIRVYVRNPFDDESIALDIAFAYSSTNSDSIEREGNDDNAQQSTFLVHKLDKPVYLILHGLNGGSHEEYVKDFVSRRRSEGSTVIVMIARGMMDTSMKGWNAFHGARTGDVDIAARAVRRGLEEVARVNGVERQVLSGVGYSMGAIIMSNYVARSGRNCALDSAVAVSGGLDMRQQLNFRRSMRLWQPMLTFGLRGDILLGKYARHYKHRLSKEQFLNLLRVTSISHLDVEAIVTYNKFDDLVHYYTEMSAMGDRQPPEFQLFDHRNEATCDSNNVESWGRIANVSVPFLVLQALDDPLVGWRTLGTENVQGLADSGSGHTMLLLTKAGGHVGWPLGTNPKQYSWKWMNDVGRDFTLAVVAAKHELKRT